MKYLTGFAILLVFASCGGGKSNMTFENDFDQIANWGYQSPMLKTGSAHSGIYYCGMDSTNEYSIAFSRYLRDFPTRNLSSVNITAWVRTKSESPKGTLIVTIDSVGGAVKYNGFPLKNFVKNSDEWTEVKGTLDLPSNMRPDFFLKVYLYNVGRENVDLDDVRFEVN